MEGQYKVNTMTNISKDIKHLNRWYCAKMGIIEYD
jgi:hypothetical protein